MTSDKSLAPFPEASEHLKMALFSIMITTLLITTIMLYTMWVEYEQNAT